MNNNQYFGTPNDNTCRPVEEKRLEIIPMIKQIHDKSDEIRRILASVAGIMFGSDPSVGMSNSPEPTSMIDDIKSLNDSVCDLEYLARKIADGLLSGLI